MNEDNEDDIQFYFVIFNGMYNIRMIIHVGLSSSSSISACV
jgi:hypothetical protein